MPGESLSGLQQPVCRRDKVLVQFRNVDEGVVEVQLLAKLHGEGVIDAVSIYVADEPIDELGS